VHLDKSYNHPWSLVDDLYKLNNRDGVNLVIMHCQIYSGHDSNMSYTPTKTIGHSGDILGRLYYEKGSLLMIDSNYIYIYTGITNNLRSWVSIKFNCASNSWQQLQVCQHILAIKSAPMVRLGFGMCKVFF
jgi:hypothetical protein